MPAIQLQSTVDTGLESTTLSTRTLDGEISRNLETDEEKKYWKLKLLHSTLSLVLFSDMPDPRLNPQVLNYLRKIFHDPDAHLDTTLTNALITPDVKIAVKDCVTNEIQKICDSLVSSLTTLLRSSDSMEDKICLDVITNSVNPIDEVLKRVQKQKEEESSLDKQLLEAAETRAAKILELEEHLTEVKPAVERLMKLAALTGQPERINTRVEYLKRKSDYLTTKTKEAEHEQILLENPPEIVSMRNEIIQKLDVAKERLKTENQRLSEFFQMYDKLEPDLKVLVDQLRTTEEAISRQEWILNRMIGFKESDDSFGTESETYF